MKKTCVQIVSFVTFLVNFLNRMKNSYCDGVCDIVENSSFATFLVTLRSLKRILELIELEEFLNSSLRILEWEIIVQRNVIGNI